MNFAPIVLFTYNRPWHTRQTVEALRKNELASESKLFIFSDGWKNDQDKPKVLEVREYLKTIDGFKRGQIIERDKNYGLANNVIDGVTKTIEEHGKVIVLEDDLVTSPFFLRYMNEALNFYENTENIISIHGYNYPMNVNCPETFFIKDANCWGWATWKRGWDLFEPDGTRLLKELQEKKLVKKFDLNGSYHFTKMLKDQIEGKNNSWAIRWRASALINDKLTLYPGVSLIHNIGNEGSGTHCGETNIFDVDISKRHIIINNIPVEENIFMLKEIGKFYKNMKGSIFNRIRKKMVRMFMNYL